MPKNAANAEVVDKGCPRVTFNYYFTKTLLHEYNLLEILMKYNLLNMAVFKELPNIIGHLRSIVNNYEYFSNKSIEIIIDMAITVLNSAADVLLPSGKLIGAGDYAYTRNINYYITRNNLYNFIVLVESIHNKIADDNRDLLENK